MQVRKYEATTIKEAVEMVKKDLGPDAIILSTRESVKGIGHRPGKKVTITAAVSEQTYQMKKVVEQNITSQEREKLHARSVKEQREYINYIYNNLAKNFEEKRRKIEARNYATIRDEDFVEQKPQAVQRTSQTFKKAPAPAAVQARPQVAPAAAVTSSSSNTAQKRVQAAAKAAFKVAAMDWAEEKKAPKAAARPAQNGLEAVQKIDELKAEIHRLQSILKGNEVFKTPETVAHYPGARQGLSKLASSMFERLIAEGFDEKLTVELLKNAEHQLKENIAKKSLLEAWIAKWIFSATEVSKEGLQGRYHFFVGPRGVGKTSTLVKMASHLVIKERKRIAIITTDVNKVGASEQLRIYSQILNVPFAAWSPGQDLNKILSYIGNVDYVLFDTEGRSLLKMQEIDEIKSMIPDSLGSVKVHLVLSALLKDEELYSTARRFKSINYSDIVVTNLDQLRRHGMLVSFQQQIQSPYLAFSMGPMIPEDFEWASKERVLDLIFRISRAKSEGGKND